jgi:hypothetical protein
MSHNKITISGQQPDSTGNVNVSMGNLSDTDISNFSTNQTLVWNGSQWVNSLVPAGTTEYIRIGQGENSGAQWPLSNVPNAQNRRLLWYDTSPVNTITGATLTKLSTTDWYEYITLPSGQYLIIMNTNVPFAASGYISYNLTTTNSQHPGANILTQTAKIGDNATTFSGGCASTIHSYLSLSSTTSLEPTVFFADNVSTNRSHYQGVTDEQTSLVVMKV